MDQDYRDMRDFAERLAAGKAPEEEMESKLLQLAEKGETVADMMAFVRPYARAAVPLPTRHEFVLDMCGTGGSSFRTYNVSTLASIVVSACGVPVAKHGNRSYNGICGSADVLRELGVQIDCEPSVSSKMLDEIGLAFLFAPKYHPAMKHVAQVRKRIGRKTIFNALGPLLNPAVARKRHLLGVYNEGLQEVMARVLRELGSDRALVVHGHPGMDEVSTLGPTRIIELNQGTMLKYHLSASQFGLETPHPEDVGELSPGAAAGAALEVLKGAPGPRADMVALNAACGLYVFGRVSDIGKGLDMAFAVLNDGSALAQLDRLRVMSHGA